jgi:hypothetical protein
MAKIQEVKDERKIKLIELVRTRPELFDKKSEEYKNSSQKKLIWIEFAGALNYKSEF